MQADDRQAQQPIEESAALEERDAPLTAESSTITVDTHSDIADANGPGPTANPTPFQQPHRLNVSCVYHMTARKAIKKNPDEAIPVIRKELETLPWLKAFHERNCDELEPGHVF